MYMAERKVLVHGACEFEIFEDVGKTGKPYKAMKLKLKDYELRQFVFINEDQWYIIQSKLNQR